MALSQNVVINFLTKFDKKGLDRATKELKGFDKFIASSKFVTKAALVTAGIAGAYALDRLARSSISAALQQEKLDKSIEQSLASINELGAVAGVKEFIRDLEDASNISKEQLTPALNSLIIQTGDLTKAQDLFNVAVDTSVGAQIDLASVTDALGKASRGQFAAIGKLGLGFNAVTAAEMGLADITDYITLKFGGAAARNAATFGAKLDSLGRSANAAQENLGQGFITAAEIIIGSSDATDVFGQKLETLGLNGGYVLIGLGAKIKDLGDQFTGISDKIGGSKFLRFLFFPSPSVLGTFDALGDAFRSLAKDGKKISDTGKETVAQTEEQKANAAKLLALQAKFDKFAASSLNKAKDAKKLKEAELALDKKRSELEAMFDMDKINLQAALSRKLNAEDEIRVKILQKLADGTKSAVDEAQRYADVLKVIEDGKITSEEVEMLAKKWGMTTPAVLLYLQQLFAANDELRKMLALMDELAKKKFAQVSLEGISPKIQKQILTGVDPVAAGEQVRRNLGKELGDLDPTGAGAAASGRLTAQAIAYYQNLLDIPRMAEGGVVTSPTLAMIGEAGAEAVIPLDRMGSMGGTRVTVNVAGSVISEGQLQTAIQDVLYNLNRTGAVTQLANLGR